MYRNTIKAINDNGIASITVTRGNTESIFSKNRSKTRLLTFPSLTLYNIGSLSQSNKARKTRSIQILEEEFRVSLFIDDVILYTEKPKFSTKISYN